MELKYFKQLIIFIVSTILISILLLSLTDGLIWLAIGLVALFLMSGYSYLASLKDCKKYTGKDLKFELNHFIPLILYYLISIPIAIVLAIINEKIYLVLGLIAVLLYISVIIYWGMRRILKD